MTQDFKEDYPGQADEIRRDRLVRKAIDAADGIICEGADGSVEEINFLTSRVALAFHDKVHCAITAALRAKEMKERQAKDVDFKQIAEAKR